jgi:hypothetical protein
MFVKNKRTLAYKMLSLTILPILAKRKKKKEETYTQVGQSQKTDLAHLVLLRWRSAKARLWREQMCGAVCVQTYSGKCQPYHSRTRMA